jgi:hypothetical protein
MSTICCHKHAAALMKVFREQDKIQKMSDSALSQEIINNVLGNMVFGKRDELLLDEYIKRFERRAGIRRDETGEIY